MAKSSITVSTLTPKQPKRDIISSLPGAIVRHILSYLDTKHAVRTSILSKTWRYTWTRLSNFSFDDRLVHVDQLDIFKRYVNTVLLFHRSALKILKLHLEKLPHEDINLYICAAIMQNVEELDLSIKDDPYKNTFFKLPKILFTCKTIKILRLCSEIDFKVGIDDSVSFPNLKVLHMLYLRNFNDLTIEKILAKAPLLEELSMQTIIPFSYGKTLRIQSSSLKHLIIRNDKTLSICRRMLIKAPKLEFLHLNDFLSQEFEVERLSSLANATIEVGQCKIILGTDPVSYRSLLEQLLLKLIILKRLSRGLGRSLLDVSRLSSKVQS